MTIPRERDAKIGRKSGSGEDVSSRWDEGGSRSASSSTSASGHGLLCHRSHSCRLTPYTTFEKELSRQYAAWSCQQLPNRPASRPPPVRAQLTSSLSTAFPPVSTILSLPSHMNDCSPQSAALYPAIDGRGPILYTADHERAAKVRAGTRRGRGGVEREMADQGDWEVMDTT